MSVKAQIAELKHSVVTRMGDEWETMSHLDLQSLAASHTRLLDALVASAFDELPLMEQIAETREAIEEAGRL